MRDSFNRNNCCRKEAMLAGTSAKRFVEVLRGTEDRAAVEGTTVGEATMGGTRVRGVTAGRVTVEKARVRGVTASRVTVGGAKVRGVTAGGVTVGGARVRGVTAGGVTVGGARVREVTAGGMTVGEKFTVNKDEEATSLVVGGDIVEKDTEPVEKSTVA